MSRMPKISIHRPAGFSLVEIMVGLVIGMLALIVMTQIFALSEERKRNATSGGDAQSNGVIMFYQMQRDISQAGYGFSAINLFNCNVSWPLAGTGTSIATPIPLAPVTINPSTSIIPAGDLNTDTLLVIYGNTNGEPQGNPITLQAANVYTVQMASSFNVGDRVIAAPAACTTTLLIDQIASTAATTVTTTTASPGTTFFNLGQTPTMLAYAIRGGNLTVCDYVVNDCGLAANKNNASIWMPIASNIVSMKAVYGSSSVAASPVLTQAVIDTTSPRPSYVVDTYNQTAPTTGCGWARTPAVALALVARSTQYDKNVVTTTALNAPAQVNAPTWDENAVDPMVAATGTLGPDAAADEPWKHYRYRVFQVVVPIRNVAWMGVTAGC